MSCDPFAVEAYLLGELQPAEAAEVGAHLGACLGCARELAALRSEREAMSSRRSLASVPAFEAVLLASRAPQPKWASRRAPGLAAAAISAAAAVVLLFSGGAQPVAEASGGACFLPEATGAAAVELALATEESRFDQCLVASPAPGRGCF